MFVICPLSNCGSPQKRDRFLEYLSKIAPVTFESEPQCKAYAWLRSAENNDAVPHHWLRGLEVYETVEANTVTHRASAPYKKFRSAVAEESLLDRPSDLHFWHPTGTGFLNRPGATTIMKFEGDKTCKHAMVYELQPRVGSKRNVMEQLRHLSELATQAAAVHSFWVLDRGEDVEDEGIYVFSLFENQEEAVAFERGAIDDAWEKMKLVCEWTRRTTWKECGIGFIGRS